MRRLSALLWPASLAAGALVLSTVSLLLTRFSVADAVIVSNIQILDLAAFALVAGEFTLRIRAAPVKRNFFRQDIVAHLLLLFSLFLYGADVSMRLALLTTPTLVTVGSGAHQTILIIRNTLLLTRVISRVRKVTSIVTDLVLHPARTVAFSFLLVIVVGTLILMMPFTTLDQEGLPLVDALFTATSAVCVTGLIVVDTATVFTMWGQIVIMILIQIGGLGIMILSLFAVVVMRQSMTVENQVLLSYMLSESRINELSRSLKRIILITFSVEAVGAILLFFLFTPVADGLSSRVFLAIFHAVSAFCNAGFAIFTTSLEQFKSNFGINIVVAGLIIAGGLSFTVLTNLVQFIRTSADKRLRGSQIRIVTLTVNSRAVLIITAILLSTGFLGFYALEHGRTMAEYPLGTQYLAAFFQSVTLRTAGFNTVPMGDLATATYLMMIVFMFIGGAAGSTAGGLKVNNVAVIAAFLESTRRKRRQTLLFDHAVSDRQTATAFSVLLFGLLSVLGGTFLLSLTETGTLTQHLFETVSAFATVGLTTGITPELSTFGRVVLTVIMFIGRVGPLTLLAASSGPRDRTRIEYPSAAIMVG